MVVVARDHQSTLITGRFCASDLGSCQLFQRNQCPYTARSAYPCKTLLRSWVDNSHGVAHVHSPHPQTLLLQCRDPHLLRNLKSRQDLHLSPATGRPRQTTNQKQSAGGVGGAWGGVEPMCCTRACQRAKANGRDLHSCVRPWMSWTLDHLRRDRGQSKVNSTAESREFIKFRQNLTSDPMSVDF